jgi:excisionase family DNA binding protein
LPLLISIKAENASSMTSAPRTPNHPTVAPPAGLSINASPTDWAAVLTPLFAEIDRQSRRAAREEYELLLAEKAADAVEEERNDQVLTVEQAAALLEVRPQTVYEWIKADKLKSYKVGRSVRLKRGQVLAALQAQTKPDGRRKYARRSAGNKKAR